MKVPVVSEQGDSLGSVSVAVSAPKGRSERTLILAHGAGGTMKTPSLVSLAEALATSGTTVVRFNFLYTEKGKRSPDRQPSLVACWRSVADWARSELKPKRLFVGGRSMGGRMASYLVADGYSVDGLVFLAYPLHPPGKPDQQRKDHLPAIPVPMLFVSGTRDTFAKLEHLEPLVAKLGASLHLIEGADHGFKAPKKYGKTPAEIAEDVQAAVSRFMSDTESAK